MWCERMRFKFWLKIIAIFFCVGFLMYEYYNRPIPRIIHYVWVGNNPEPEYVKQVIGTWKKHAPHYRINKIDETNCNVSAHEFVRGAYREKKWEMVADYCRFVALEKEGGLYLDTDHVLKGNPDDLLAGADRVFTLERLGQFSASFIAVKPHDPIIKRLKFLYENLAFYYPYFRHFYMSPKALTVVFNEYFGFEMSMPFYEKDGTRVLPTNVAMLDLGGGENIAEHLYDGFGTGDERGTWYKHFVKLFLEKATTPICDKESRYRFIFNRDKEGYLFETKEWADVKLKKSRKLILYWRNAAKLQTYEKRNGCFYAVVKPGTPPKSID